MKIFSIDERRESYQREDFHPGLHVAEGSCNGGCFSTLA